MTYKYFIIAIAPVLLYVSCDRQNNKPGYIYFPDMAYSRAYETYSENPVFANGRTLQNPVEGTISREMIPYPYSKEDRVMAGMELKNPFPATDENIARGKREFGIFCIGCHGEKGDGKGYLFTSGKYPFPVKSLLSETVQGVPDGEIFHVITCGFGVMGAHGPQILPEDRWKIVGYIKRELGKQQGK